MFQVGDLEAQLTLDRTPFNTGLRMARADAARFQREGIKATVNLDAANAERRLAEIDRDRTIHGDYELDTTAAEAKITLLEARARNIGGGIGGGGTGGGGGGILGPGGFFRPSPLIAAGALGASFLPTIGASAVQGALGAGALGLGAGAAGAVGGAGILAAAKPAVTALGNVTKAQDTLNTAIATYGKDSAQAKTATQQLRAAQAQLPESGQRVASSLEDIEARWSRLSAPAQNQFFGALGDGLKEADRLLPGFAKSADTSMTAARGAFDHFLGIFNTPDFQTFETTMTHTFAAGIGPLERGVENIGHVLERIVVASAPDVLRMLNGFQDVTHGWEQDTRNAADLQHSVHGTVQEFGDWFDLAGSLGHLLSALFITNEQGAKRGGREVEAVSRQLDQWARWIEHHHHDINSFFGQLNDDVGLLLGSAGQIASVVLPAFKPVGDIIHEIVSDLNSLKVGNVSALTVLLGVMAGRGIAGRLGLIGGAAGAAEGAAGVGLLARIGSRAGFGAAAGTELAPGLVTGEAGGAGLGAAAGGAALLGLGAAGAVGTVGAFTSEGGLLDTLHGHATANLTNELGGQLAEGIAHGINRDRSVQRAFHGMTIEQLRAVRHDTLAQAHFLGTDAAQTLGNAVADEGHKIAGQTARMAADQIDGMKLGTRLADAVAEGKGDVRKILKDYEQRFEALPPAARDAAVKSAKVELDQLQEMGLITKKQERQTLNDLEDMQAQSQRKQRQKWDQFGRITNRLIAGWFGSMNKTVDTLLGNKGITGMVNQLLTGVASQHKLKWNATTAGTVAGTLAGFLGIGGGQGGQRGGFTGGWSSFDDRMVPMRGNEAVLRGEDHVPIVSRALQATYGFGLGDMFARTGSSGNIGSGFARGGRVSVLPNANMSVGDEPAILNDLRAFAGIEGKTVYVISGYRTPQHSVAVGGFADDPHTRGEAADIGLGSPTTASMASTGLENPLNRVGLYRPFYPPSIAEANHVQLLHGGAGVTVHGRGGIGSIPRIVIHGPKGGVHDGLQGIADQSRHAANDYLQSFMASVGTAGGGTVAPKSLPPSLRKYDHVWAEHMAPDFGGPTMPFNKIAELAEWAGSGHIPGVTMAQVTKGESGSRPGSAGVDPGGTRGYGLWAITTGVGNDAMIQALGGPQAMLNPIVNAQAMAKIYAGSGLGAWYGTGFVTDPNAHYTGPMHLLGGSIPPGGSGMVHPPELLVHGGDHGVGVVSQEDTMRLLRKAAGGGGDGTPDIRLIVKGDIVSQHADPVEAVIGDRRFPVAVQREITGRNAYGRQLDRMHSR